MEYALYDAKTNTIFIGDWIQTYSALLRHLNDDSIIYLGNL
jgi:hypothetical protein